MNKKIYELTTEDVQNVALQEIDRELTLEEINNLEDLISKRIDWYDVISDAIAELNSTNKD